MIKQKTVKTVKVFPLESFAIYGNICTHIHTYVDVLNQHVDYNESFILCRFGPLDHEIQGQAPVL